jgi:hypothetical protein
MDYDAYVHPNRVQLVCSLLLRVHRFPGIR